MGEIRGVIQDQRFVCVFFFFNLKAVLQENVFAIVLGSD